MTRLQLAFDIGELVNTLAQWPDGLCPESKRITQNRLTLLENTATALGLDWALLLQEIPTDETEPLQPQ